MIVVEQDRVEEVGEIMRARHGPAESSSYPPVLVAVLRLTQVEEKAIAVKPHRSRCGPWRHPRGRECAPEEALGLPRVVIRQIGEKVTFHLVQRVRLGGGVVESVNVAGRSLPFDSHVIDGDSVDRAAAADVEKLLHGIDLGELQHSGPDLGTP